MIDKETILRLARESGIDEAFGPFPLTAKLEAFATALLAHRAESGVEVPEHQAWLKHENGMNHMTTSDAIAEEDGGYQKMVSLYRRAESWMTANCWNWLRSVNATE